MKNVLIVSQNSITTLGLKTLLEEHGIFSTEDVRAQNINSAIIDIGDSFETDLHKTIQLKHDSPQTKIIVLSARNEQNETIRLLQLGVNAICEKSISNNDLIKILELVENGGGFFSEKTLKTIQKSVKKDHKAPNESFVNLTKRESDVLKLIKEGYSNSEIAKKLYISINTTKAHIGSILQKLDIKDRTQAAIKAIEDNIV